MTFTGPIDTLPAGATPVPTDLLPTWQNAQTPKTRQITIAQALAGAGAIITPGTVTSGDLVSFSGTTGQLIEDSGVLASSVLQNTSALLLPQLATITALQAATSGTLPQSRCYVLGYATAGDGGGGVFYVGTATTANGGTIINDASSRSWYRETGAGPYSVRWFGATGNGTTNDTTAVANCLAAAVGFVYIPRGTYALDGITIPANALVLGAGLSTILQPIASGFSAGQFITLGGNNIEFGECQINVSSTTYSTTPTIYALSQSGLNIHDITVTQGGQFAVFLDGGSNNLIQRCTSLATASYGMYALGETGTRFVLCNVSGVAGVNGMGIQFNGCTGCQMSQCSAANTPAGGFGLSLWLSSLCSIVSCKSFNTISEGMQITDCQSCAILDSTLYWTGSISQDFGLSCAADNFSYSTNNGNNIIKGNTIQGCGKAGIAIAGNNTSGTFTNDGNLVEGNNIVFPCLLNNGSPEGQAGIIIYGLAADNTVLGNQVFGNGTTMLYGVNEITSGSGAPSNNRVGLNGVFSFNTAEVNITGSGSLSVAW